MGSQGSFSPHKMDTGTPATCSHMLLLRLYCTDSEHTVRGGDADLKLAQWQAANIL